MLAPVNWKEQLKYYTCNPSLRFSWRNKVIMHAQSYEHWSLSSMNSVWAGAHDGMRPYIIAIYCMWIYHSVYVIPALIRAYMQWLRCWITNQEPQLTQQISLTFANERQSLSSCSYTDNSHPSSVTVCHNPSLLQFLITETLGLVWQVRIAVSPARVVGQEYMILFSVEVVSASHLISISKWIGSENHHKNHLYLASSAGYVYFSQL